MAWEVQYNNEQVRVHLSELLPDECRIDLKVNDSWREVYCGSIEILKNFHRAYAAVYCEILGNAVEIAPGE